MRRAIVAVSSATTSAAIPVSWGNQFQVGFGVVLSNTPTLTYKVQYTFDDVQDSSITPTWFDHPVTTGLTANSSNNFAYPVSAIRLNVTAWTAGTATLTILSASY